MEVKYIMKYTKPMAELEKFALVDVVTTSGKPSGGGENYLLSSAKYLMVLTI